MKKTVRDSLHSYDGPLGELPCIAQALFRSGKGNKDFTITLVATLATNVFKLPIGPQTLALAWLHRFEGELSSRDVPQIVLDNIKLLQWAMEEPAAQAQEGKSVIELARANPDVRAVLVYIYYWDSSAKARKYREFLLDKPAPVGEVKP